MQTFYSLIDQLNASDGEERARIERQIRDTYECEKVVLALDMSGFSLTVRREGILSYLCRIRQMQLVCGPKVAFRGGSVVKQVADNLMVVFDDPNNALHAAVEINRTLTAQQRDLHGKAPVEVSIGLDVGKILFIPGNDCFGDTVNIAYKLGEDVARGGEILITEEVRRRLGTPPPYGLEPFTLSISGLEIRAHKVLY